MQRSLQIGFILSTCAFLGGCSSSENKIAYAQEATGGLESITVSSPAFKFGKAIPKLYTADGRGISPPLAGNKAPEPAQQYVLIIEAPDASRAQPFVHWIVYDLPASTVSLPEGISPPGAKTRSEAQHWIEGTNSAG